MSGIYESLRAYEGMIFRLDDHLERFFESAKTVGIEIPESRGTIKKKLKDALRDSGKKEAFLRLTLTAPSPLPSPPRGRGEGEEGVSIIVTERKHPAEIYNKGISLRTTAVRRSPSEISFPEAKSTDCLNQILGILDPAPPGNYETLFLNKEGYLTEATIGNLFVVKNGALWTPPSHGLLSGVTRRFVLECASLGKIPVEEKPLMRHDLFNAEEAFLTNTSWEILPIREVDRRRIGSGIPGSVTRKLMELFRQKLGSDLYI